MLLSYYMLKPVKRVTEYPVLVEKLGNRENKLAAAVYAARYNEKHEVHHTQRCHVEIHFCFAVFRTGMAVRRLI